MFDSASSTTPPSRRPSWKLALAIIAGLAIMGLWNRLKPSRIVWLGHPVSSDLQSSSNSTVLQNHVNYELGLSDDGIVVWRRVQTRPTLLELKYKQTK